MSINRIHARETLCHLRSDETGSGCWSDQPGDPDCRAAEQVKETIDHMLQHLDQPLRVSVFSSMAGFSNSHFFVLFKSATGYAPKEFFIRLRMRRAGELLRATTMSVKEVAALLGYNDPFYFSRLFKSVHGVAPSYYRLRITGASQADGNGTRLHSEKEIVESLPSPQLTVSKQFGNDGLKGASNFELNGDSTSVSRATPGQQLKAAERLDPFSECQ